MICCRGASSTPPGGVGTPNRLPVPQTLGSRRHDRYPRASAACHHRASRRAGSRAGRLRAVPDVRQLPAAAVQRATTGSAWWVRANRVILAAVVLIVAQLCWKAYLLSHFYFRQDDFLLLDRALSRGLSLHYLFAFSGGHLRPGGLVVFWLVTRLSPYDWLLASILTIAALAAAGVLMLRLLVILFGSRP